MKANKPKDHTLYWAYAWDEKETEYNFDTDVSLVAIRKKAKELLEEDFDHVYIWYGDDAGAFTHLDYVELWAS